MSKFKWEPEYAIGHAEIDRQHQGIIDILNVLYELIHSAENDQSDKVEVVFDQLAAYVTNHFSYEEGLLDQKGYPTEKLAEHKRAHQRLLSEVQRIAAAYQSGDMAALDDLLPYLYGSWLTDHICHEDRDYESYVNA